MLGISLIIGFSPGANPIENWEKALLTSKP